MYAKYIKRILDFILSFTAMIVLSPLLLLLTIIDAIEMKGNPFFVQKRPGKIERHTGQEKIFSLIKFRTMTNARDEQGELLPDKERITKFGSFLRQTSLDELPEIFNILRGDMSIIGPRPLMVEYLPYYSAQERHRHDVRPGLTGLAQIKGRSFIQWEEIFRYDLEYVRNVCFREDCVIFLKTIKEVLRRDDIADVSIIEYDADGTCYVCAKGQRMRLHQPLNVERTKQNVE